MSGELTYKIGDLYPNMGYGNTRTEVQPEEEDQMALVDDQKVAQEYSKNPKAKFNIFTALIALLAIALIMGVINHGH